MAAFLELLRNHPFAVALIGGLALFAAILIYKLLKRDLAFLDIRLSGEVKKLDTRLSGEINKLDTKLSGEMKKLDTRLSGEIKKLDTRLSGEVKHTRELLVLKLEPIEKQLANHVTGANKKIEKLEKDMKEGHIRLESKLDELLNKQEA